jgi:hypothetical protein
MLTGKFVLTLMLADGGYRGWRFTGGFPLQIHTEILFRGFHGRNARVGGI